LDLAENKEKTNEALL